MGKQSNTIRLGLVGWFLCAFYLFYKILIQYSSGIFAPDLLKDFPISIQELGIINNNFSFTYILMQIPMGMLVDRFGPRRVLTICATLFAISCIAFGLAHNPIILSISRLLMGAMATPAVCSALYIAAKFLPLNHFALIAGLTDTIGMLGGALAQIILFSLTTLFGWRVTIILCGKFGLGLAICLWLLVRDRPLFTPEPEHSSRRRERSAFKKLYHVVSQPQVWLASTAGGLLLAHIIVFSALWCTPYLVARYHIPYNTAAFASSLVFFGEVMGAPLAALLSNYIERRQPIIMFGAILSCIFFLTILYIPSLPLWDMYGLLFGLGLFTGPYIMAFAIVRENTHNTCLATAMAFTNTLCVLFGYMILEPLTNWLLNVHQFILASTANQNIPLATYQSALFSVVLSLIIAACVSYFIQETYCIDQEWRSDKTFL